MNDIRKNQTVTVGELVRMLLKQDQDKPVFFVDALPLEINSIYVDADDGVVLLAAELQAQTDAALSYLADVNSRRKSKLSFG